MSSRLPAKRRRLILAAWRCTSPPDPLCLPAAVAQRVQIALKEKGLDYSVRQVDLANKDDEFLAMYRAILPDPAASAKVGSSARVWMAGAPGAVCFCSCVMGGGGQCLCHSLAIAPAHRPHLT